VGTPSNYSNEARRQAAHILSQPPFVKSPSHIPDPLAGVLHGIGRVITDVIGKPAAWAWRHISSLTVGVFGRFTWLVVTIVAVGIGVLVGTLLIRRRTRIGPRNTTVHDVPAREDVAMLEAEADAAEARGDLEGAVRLRFRAGLTRLESAGVIASRLVTTTGQVRQAVHNPAFDSLAERHEAIAYAGQPASPADAGSARERWPRVIAEVAPPGERTHKP
jgi:hypothetical protein